MRIAAIILSSLTGVLALITIGAIACNQAPGAVPGQGWSFPVNGWWAVATCIAAVASIIVVVIALKR